MRCNLMLSTIIYDIEGGPAKGKIKPYSIYITKQADGLSWIVSVLYVENHLIQLKNVDVSTTSDEAFKSAKKWLEEGEGIKNLTYSLKTQDGGAN